MSEKQSVKINNRSKHRASTSWKPGQSGNPAGKPLNKQRRTSLELFWADSPILMKKFLERAKKGDMSALKLSFEYIMSNGSQVVLNSINIPTQINLQNSKSIAQQILSSMGVGDMTIEQGMAWLDTLKAFRETALVEETSQMAKVITDAHAEVKGLPDSVGIEINSTEKNNNE